ncbi:Udp-sugar pyrophospharylase [Globisporangium polare]
MQQQEEEEALNARVVAALTKWEQQPVLDALKGQEASPSLRAQLLHFESWYRGGLDTYLRNATQLFRAQLQPNDAAQSQDEYADWLPSVPRSTDDVTGADAPLRVAQLDSTLYRDLEAVGLQHIGKSAFVVVAGGLGERLGYAGIKLKLPVETLTGKSYLETYIQHLLALQALANASDTAANVRVPLAIMTSDVTHEATWEFLVANAFFGMEQQQVALIKQEKVPCLQVHDQQLQLALELVLNDDNDNQQAMIMKPHGHGDVHSLLHSSGLAAAWLQQGKQYVHFFQDTNFLIVNSFLPMLGASVRNQWAFNFTSVQRKAKDASGAVVRFSKPPQAAENGEDDGGDQVAALLNVEYHELDQFLRTKAHDQFPDGDANDPSTNFSLFPGNINHFVVELASYNTILNASKGFVPELFNPKYRSDGRNFKSPARLECMMQDYPKLLVEFRDLLSASAASSSGHLAKQNLQQSRIGLVLFPPELVYSPCKNDVDSARAKAQQDIPPQCAGSAEHDLFAINRERLAAVLGSPSAFGGTGSVDEKQEWLGIPLDCGGSQLVFAPSFAPSQSILHSRFPSPADVRISKRSTLVVDGTGAVTIYKLALDGALRISACKDAIVEIRSLSVQNAGYIYEGVEITAETDPIDAMRGYQFRKLGLRELVFDAPGHYIIDE